MALHIVMEEEASGQILIVCAGNTCRSPMAEQLLRHALAVEKPPLNRLVVVSAGLSAFEGAGASPNACKALAKVGLDLTLHRSQPVTEDLLEASDVVFCMTATHLRQLRAWFPGLPLHTYLVQHFSEGLNKDADVVDPFGGPLAEYEDCRDSIVEAIPGILNFLRSRKELFIR